MSPGPASWATPIIFVAAALYCWVQWNQTSVSAALLAADPVVAQAMIMEKKLRSGPHRGLSSVVDRNRVIARFDVQGGDRTSVESSVSDAFFKRLQVGDLVDIRYARSNPQIAEIEPGTLDAAAKLYLVGAIVLSVLLLLLGMMIAVYRSAMAQVRRSQVH